MAKLKSEFENIGAFTAMFVDAMNTLLIGVGHSFDLRHYRARYSGGVERSARGTVNSHPKYARKTQMGLGTILCACVAFDRSYPDLAAQ